MMSKRLPAYPTERLFDRVEIVAALGQRWLDATAYINSCCSLVSNSGIVTKVLPLQRKIGPCPTHIPPLPWTSSQRSCRRHLRRNLTQRISSGRDADNQAGSGNNAIVGTKDGSTEPAGAPNQVTFNATTSHEFAPFQWSIRTSRARYVGSDDDNDAGEHEHIRGVQIPPCFTLAGSDAHAVLPRQRHPTTARKRPSISSNASEREPYCRRLGRPITV